MGEWSKSIGEKGEEVVGLLMELIGWGTDQKGIDLPCSQVEHLGEGGNPRTSHGVDYLYSYRSPLCDDLCDNLVISVKYSDSAYPKNQTKFKGYYADLVEAIGCFSKSDLYNKQKKSFKGCDKFRTFGVLFWLNNIDVFDEHKSVVANVDVQKTKDHYDGVYFVDNKTASFLYDAITYVKASESDSEISFDYIETGKYTNPASRNYYGKTLPIEYLNLGILPIRAMDKNGVNTLYLCCSSPFEEDSLGRLIGLSQSISQSWANKTKILFSSYDNLSDSNLAGGILNSFSDRGVIEKLIIGTFRPNFKNQ